MQRVLIYSHEDSFLFELSENEVYSLRRYSAVNGQHYLDIETSTVLEKGMRVLTSDERGRWHEHVVSKTDEDHASGEYMTGKYRCFWSLQHDLTVSRTNHILNTASALEALNAVLSGTSRWTVGQVGVTGTASASMYRTTAWQALQTLVKTWGGEVEAVIGVDQTGVISRSVSLLAHVGSSEVTRRFDYGEDMISISRQADDSPLVCRIIPLGKGEQSGDGYGRKITIESVNSGLDYLQNDSMAPLVRMPDGNGGWEYPYAYIENGDIEDPQELKDWALSILEEATSPKVTYKANVLQLSLAGMDAFGVSEGDPVYCVDRTFTAEGIRVYGRVTALDEDLLEPSNTKLTIGYLGKSIVASAATTIAALSGSLARLSIDASGAIDLSDTYMQAMINRLNEEANATGGYFYYVVGEGVRTYDVAVSDPSVGAEASMVVEIKGGTIRIANSRTSGGDWNWKTVFTSGFISADLIHGGTFVAGGANNVNGTIVVLDANGDTMCSFDQSGAYIVGNINLRTDGYYSGYYYTKLGVVRALNTYGYESDLRGLTIYESGDSLSADYDPFIHLIPAEDRRVSGSTFHNSAGNLVRTQMAFIDFAGPFSLRPYRAFANTTTENPRYADLTFSSDGNIYLSTPMLTSSMYSMQLKMTSQSTTLYYGRGAGNNSFIEASNRSSDNTQHVTVRGTFTATGTKSRLVDTEHYGERLMYAYETPSPMFGDIGSATVGEDGYAYVSVDDIFAETARTDIGYHVFVQKCGEGDLWVAEKHPNYFVVRGTPNLPFDWELKARQLGYEELRLEDKGLSDVVYEGGGSEAIVSETIAAYGGELNYQSYMESVYGI